MARGKEAASSARQRLEAAHAHIDRLTDDLVDAKTRARAVEQEANRVPALAARVLELEQMVADVTSPVVDRLRDEHAAEVKIWREHAAGAIRLLTAIMNQEWGGDLTLSREEWAEYGGIIDALAGEADAPTRITENRSQRRIFIRNAKTVRGHLERVDALPVGADGIPELLGRTGVIGRSYQ